MYIDYNDISEYPFTGEFYRTIIDDDASLLEQESSENEQIILNTKCDIQNVSQSRGSTLISASFVVFFPFNEEISIKRGDMFRGSMYNMDVNGKVVGVFPTQLKGCVVYIDDKNA